jgi:hypothetical protein
MWRAGQTQELPSFSWHAILLRKEQAPDNQYDGLKPKSGNDLRRKNYECKCFNSGGAKMRQR